MSNNSRIHGRANGTPTGNAPAQRRLPLSGNPGAEQKLIDGCVAGNAKAWEELLLRYRDSLHLRIRAILGSRSRDANLVDEIAAEVWSTLYRKNGRLLGRFHVKNGQPLTAFLAGIARIEVLRFLRADHRRRRHEMSPEIIQRTPAATNDDGYRLATVGLDEFAEGLTPHQRQFLREHLLEHNKRISSVRLTPTNHWQLRHRIRCKLLEFLE